eukprot:7189334-Prymnesium_polylepis.2
MSHHARNASTSAVSGRRECWRALKRQTSQVAIDAGGKNRWTLRQREHAREGVPRVSPAKTASYELASLAGTTNSKAALSSGVGVTSALWPAQPARRRGRSRTVLFMLSYVLMCCATPTASDTSRVQPTTPASCITTTSAEANRPVCPCTKTARGPSSTLRDRARMSRRVRAECLAPRCAPRASGLRARRARRLAPGARRPPPAPRRLPAAAPPARMPSRRPRRRCPATGAAAR